MNIYWNLVCESDETLFDNNFASLENTNETFYNDLVAIGVEKWANSKCPLPKYGKFTTNSAESLNAAIKKFINKM